MKATSAQSGSETITRSAQAQGRYARQAGGRHHYAEVWLKVEPLPSGQEFVFVQSVADEAVPQRYRRFIESGVREAMESGGPVAGHSLLDIKVTLFDGSYHELFSEDQDFKLASVVAFKQAVYQARPVLLELIMRVEIQGAQEYAGAVEEDLKGRRGKILQVEAAAGAHLIQAEVPQVELFGYELDLHELTHGQARLTKQVAHYARIGR